MLLVVAAAARRQTVAKNECTYIYVYISDPHQDSVTISSLSNVEDVKSIVEERPAGQAERDPNAIHTAKRHPSLDLFFFFKNCPLPLPAIVLILISAYRRESQYVHTFTLCLASALVLLFAMSNAKK